MNGRAVAKPVMGDMIVDAQNPVPLALTGKTEMHHVNMKIITKQQYMKTMFHLIVKKVLTV